MKKPDNNMDDTNHNSNGILKTELKDLIVPMIQEYMSSTGFTNRKLTDTPTDANQVVNRKYLTNNGTLANRPKSSVAVVGQPYLATDTSIPMTYTSGGWVNGVGSIVALNN